MEQIGSIYTNRRRLGLLWFFLQGFMLNLLVAGLSRDKAGAERELISLCRKTIIRLIEPPGSETLQPEILAVAEQAERAGADPWAGGSGPGSRGRGSPDPPEPGRGAGPALSRERPQTL